MSTGGQSNRSPLPHCDDDFGDGGDDGGDSDDGGDGDDWMSVCACPSVDN